MTEEEKNGTTTSPSQDKQDKAPEAPAQRPQSQSPENGEAAKAPAPPAGEQERPQSKPPYQGQRPAGPPRPYGQQPQGPRPPQRSADGSQRTGAPQQPGSQSRPAQPGNRQPIDWLRSKPVPSGGRTAQPPRGLDLGRPDAWSGRQKPPTPSAPGQRPPQPGEQRPSGPGAGSRPPDSQPYRGSRPAGTPGQPYQGRPSGTGYQGTPRPGGFGTPRPGGFGTPRPGGFGTPRPGGFGTPRPGGFGTPRPGGFGPSRGPGGRPPFSSRPSGPSTEWGKGSSTSRRARSERKGGKVKDKPATDEELAARGRNRPDGEPVRGRPGLSTARPGAAKSRLDTATPDIGKAIIVPPQLTVKELAEVLGISSVEIIKELMKSGIMAPINQQIDYDTASIVASDLGFEIRLADAQSDLQEAAPVTEAQEIAVKSAKFEDVQDDPSTLQPRPPVVTIMGHVDHGKTSLLDAIRRTDVAGGEFGGITQHIGAYQVEEKNQKITFLDTPGHEAFTAMRARGAQVTDIAIVVVAADDGVQPQTLEAINHARAAGVPIVVALNKIDKDNANPERVKQQLSDAGLLPEDWGGSTVVVPVSARSGTGVSDLLDMILLVSEMAALKANPDRLAIGTIVEAEMDKARGPLATVLVQKGTLKVGDFVVVGAIHGKIKAMFNDKGKAIRKALPSTPASILGLSDVPQSGDTLRVVADERTARSIVDEEVDRLQRAAVSPANPTLDMERLSSMIAAGTVKELDIVLKADVQGSLEPIANSIKKLGDEKENVKVRLIHQATGMITEWDVALAAASRAAGASKASMVIGFNVDADSSAKRTAEVMGVEIRTFKIIYDIIDVIDRTLRGLYEPKYQEVVDGHAEVRQVFKLGKSVMIAGAIVNDGTLVRGANVRVRRNNTVVFDGKLSSLRRFKDDVRDVSAGYECGITLDGFNDIQERDIIETYHQERVN